MCRKCNKPIGDYNHCGWEGSLVNSTVKDKTPFSKASLLLNVWGDDSIPSSTSDQIAIMTSVAKTVIAWRWKNRIKYR